MGHEPHVVLEVVKVVTHQAGNGVILLCQLVFKVLGMTLKDVDLLFKGLNMSKLFHLHDHCIVFVVHYIVSL